MPVPLTPAVIVIHAALLVAVQLQPAAAVTVTTPVPALDVALAEAGEIVGVHGAPACVTVKVLPAIVTVPVRDVVPVFAATSYVTDPLPLPVAPALIVIQAALLVAVHAHPLPAVTVTVPLTVVEATLADAGAIVGVHGAPACVTVKVLPAIVTVPVRDVAPVFAATS